MPVLLLAQAVAVIGTTVVIWSHLPPLHPDEMLPLVPLVRFHKIPEAWGDYVRGLSRTIFGYVVPVRSYEYEGALRALLYAPFFPFSWQAHRASNVVWVFVLFALILCCARRLGGLGAAVLAFTLLVTDFSFVYLGITEQVRFIHFILGMALFLCACACLERPRLPTAAGLALIVALGVWNKLEFLWFLAATLVATHIAVLVRLRAARALVTIDAASVLGLVGAYLIVPSYFGVATQVASLEHISPPWLRHFADLWPLVAPLGAYSRHVDVSEHLGRPVQATYAAAFLVGYVAVVAGLLSLGIAERRPTWIALAVAPVVLTLLAVVTPFTLNVHHILGMKPFVYAGAAILAARAVARPRWRVGTLVVWTALLAGSLAANVHAYAVMQQAAPLRGAYGVGWNAVHAWEAAVGSDVNDVRALDWGVFFPGIVASRADQRWDMAAIWNEGALVRLLVGKDRIGLLFRAAGPNAWLRTQTTFPVLAERVFDREPGDAWVFLVLGPHTR